MQHGFRKLGSWPLAVTSYNHGIGGMQRAKDRFGHNFPRIVKHYDHPLFGFASRNYYAEFLAARDIANDPERFFPEGIRYESGSDWTLAASDADAGFTPRPRAPRRAQPTLKVASASRIEQSKAARFSTRKVARFETKKAARFDPKKTERASLSTRKHIRSTSGNVRGRTQRKAIPQVGERTIAERNVPRVVLAHYRAELRAAETHTQPGRASLK